MLHSGGISPVCESYRTLNQYCSLRVKSLRLSWSAALINKQAQHLRSGESRSIRAALWSVTGRTGLAWKWRGFISGCAWVSSKTGTAQFLVINKLLSPACLLPTNIADATSGIVMFVLNYLGQWLWFSLQPRVCLLVLLLWTARFRLKVLLFVRPPRLTFSPSSPFFSRCRGSSPRGSVRLTVSSWPDRKSTRLNSSHL